MSKRMMSLMAAGLLMAAAAYATDVWKDKDFQNWDQKDVQKILTDSPWSHKIQYGGGGGGSMSSPFTAAGDQAHGSSDSDPCGSGGPRDKSAINGTCGSQGMGAESSYTVTWYSSRTVREAMARNRELEGTPADDARKALSAEPTVYQVAVMGGNLMAFGKEGSDNLKAHSYLMSKKTKEKMTPTKVIIQTGQDGRRPTAIIFEFAKTTASGEPTIAKDEKGMEFSTQAGNAKVSTTFDIPKMADKQGVDY